MFQTSPRHRAHPEDLRWRTPPQPAQKIPGHLRPGRNPLVVQFWLWGMDAASGDLYAYAHNKMPCSRGSSIYQMRGWSVHSMGLICQQEGWLYYDRPGQVFYRSKHEPDFEHPTLGVSVHRSEGLLAVQGRIREYEQWIQSHRGPHHREVLLSGKLPARVRRETEAWKQWTSRDPLDHRPMLLPEGHPVVVLR